MVFVICESCHAHHKVTVITKYCPSQARQCITRTCKITRMWKPCLLILTGKWYKILMNYTRCLVCKQRYHLKQQSHFWIVNYGFLHSCNLKFPKQIHCLPKGRLKTHPYVLLRTIITENAYGSFYNTGQLPFPQGLVLTLRGCPF